MVDYNGNNAEFVIDDPEELSQKQRIRELLDRRRDVLDARTRASDEEVLGSVGHVNALTHYQNHLESLIMDLWTKLIESDDGEQYLYERHVGSVTVPPPRELQPGQHDNFAPGETAPEPKTVDIHGLEWFINNDPVVSASFEARMWNPPGKVQRPNSTVIPRSLLDKATTLCFEFMNEAGVDASSGEEDNDAGFSYPDFVNDDMLKNGDGE